MLILAALLALAPQVSHTVPFATTRGAPTTITIPAHDQANGPLTAVGTQVRCDIKVKYSVKNTSPTPAVVVIDVPTSFQRVQVFSPTGQFLGNAAFVLSPISVLVPGNGSIPTTTHQMTGLVNIIQTGIGQFPDMEGPKGRHVQLEVRFPNQLNVQAPTGVTVKQEIGVRGTIKVIYH